MARVDQDGVKLGVHTLELLQISVDFSHAAFR